MKIRILCVGKIKDKFFRDAVDEYKKRLKAFCDLEIIEIKDEKVTPSVNAEMVVQRENERLLSKMTGGYFIALDPNGKMLSSEKFADKIGSLINTGKVPITFIIGGSHGLSDKLLKRCDAILSFSPMTFPHQLFRVMLTEQIYRAFTILNHQTYHK